MAVSRSNCIKDSLKSNGIKESPRVCLQDPLRGIQLIAIRVCRRSLGLEPCLKCCRWHEILSDLLVTWHAFGKPLEVRVITTRKQYSCLVSNIPCSYMWHLHSDILSDMFSSIYLDNLSDILCNIYSDIVSGNLSAICIWHSFWHSFCHSTW